MTGRLKEKSAEVELRTRLGHKPPPGFLPGGESWPSECDTGAGLQCLLLRPHHQTLGKRAGPGELGGAYQL